MRYNNNEGFRTKINAHVIDSINIILEDDNGSKIDINNHWSITLEFNKVINDNIINIANVVGLKFANVELFRINPNNKLFPSIEIELLETFRLIYILIDVVLNGR